MIRAKLRLAPILILGLLVLAENALSLTWRGAPLSKTRSFLITEFGYGLRISKCPTPPAGDDRNFHLEWELGLMKNVRPNWAIGGTGYFSADDEGGRAALKARVRRWISPRVGLDFSAGPVIKTFGDLRTYSPGVTVGILLMNEDIVGLALNYELVPYKYIEIQPNDALKQIKGSSRGFYGGVRIGSQVGTAIGAAVPVAVLIWVLSTVGSD